MSSTFAKGPQLITVTFTGLATSGDISIPGLLPGDFPLYVYNAYNNYQQEVGNYFGTTVTAADSYHQTVSYDLSAQTFTAVFVRAVQ